MGGRRRWALAVLALVFVGGCSAENSGTSGMVDAAAPAQQKAQEQRGEGNTAPVAGSIDPNRQLVRTASVELRSEQVEATLQRVKELVLTAGGFAGQESSGESHATATLRVPGDKLDKVLLDLGKIDIAQVVRRNVTNEDVTDQMVDVEARLASQKASVERVRALFERATTTSEITQIEGELNKRQNELESLQRRHESLKGKVAMSTLTVSISRQALVASAEPAGFLGALSGGWNALVTGLGWLLIGFGAMLPFLLALGIPAAAVILIRRRRRVIPQSGEAS